ncbi:hypothetical protein [Spirosoma linguale]|uniref:hypothetical protein n=1 Tax=Spirosoma linguale TaxID=108 RepID=UPI0001A3C571
MSANETLKRAVTNDPIKLSELTTDTDILNLFAELEMAETFVNALPPIETGITSSPDISLESFQTAALSSYKALPDNAAKADVETKLGVITTTTIKLLTAIQDTTLRGRPARIWGRKRPESPGDFAHRRNDTVYPGG